MPIILITNYTWRQTSEEIIITMPITGNPTNISIFATDNYVKASYPPFMLELFLFENIIEEQSQCILGESSAVFTLKKAEVGREWFTLVHEDLTKEEKCEYRSKAVEQVQLLAEKKVKEKSEKQRELQRQAVRKQIELDTATLNKIEQIRDGHRREAMTDFENWRMHAEKPIFSHTQATIQSNRQPYRDPLKWFHSNTTIDTIAEAELNEDIKSLDHVENIKNSISQDKDKIQLENLNINSTSESTDTENSSTSTICRNNHTTSSMLKAYSSATKETNDKKIHHPIQSEKEKNSGREGKLIDKILKGEYHTCKRSIFGDTDTSIPMPRQSGTINVNFSQRVFSTPARESHHLEEQEWLEKQIEARRKCGFTSEDLRPEEQDPQWLKDKGNEFFNAGNYMAAISAYTHGIKLSDKMACLYANRSAAQYALGNYHRCAEDCSTALELTVPKCDGNREARARCHARLGAALCKLSAPQHGIAELEAAVKLAPDNDTIKCDLNEAKKFYGMLN